MYLYLYFLYLYLCLYLCLCLYLYLYLQQQCELDLVKLVNFKLENKGNSSQSQPKLAIADNSETHLIILFQTFTGFVVVSALCLYFEVIHKRNGYKCVHFHRVGLFVPLLLLFPPQRKVLPLFPFPPFSSWAVMGN